MSDFAKELASTVVLGSSVGMLPQPLIGYIKLGDSKNPWVYANHDGSIAHAQLRFGNGMIRGRRTTTC